MNKDIYFRDKYQTAFTYIHDWIESRPKFNLTECINSLPL